jgi:CMP-N-acetylneuraminic acid synthetase
MKPKEVLAIVPAKGTSVRLPGKMMMPLDGRTLVDHAFDAAKESTSVTKTVLFSNSEEIAERAELHSLDIQLIKETTELTKAPAIEYIRYVLSKLSQQGYSPDIVTVLQPTSPLRKGHHIDKGIEILLESGADSVVGLKRISDPIEWMYKLDESNSMEKLVESYAQYFQKSEEIFVLNGAFYGFTPSSFKKFEKYLFGGKMVGYVMDDLSSVDIDTKLDFIVAESLVKLNQTS